MRLSESCRVKSRNESLQILKYSSFHSLRARHFFSKNNKFYKLSIRNSNDFTYRTAALTYCSHVGLGRFWPVKDDNTLSKKCRIESDSFFVSCAQSKREYSDSISINLIGENNLKLNTTLGGIMAKRFTDTDKWGKAWYRKLSPKMKCAWEFLTTNCDVAGLWDIDIDTFEFHVGERVTLNEILAAFGDRVCVLEDKLFLPDFVPFQYGALSEDCKPHKPVIQRLKKLNLLKGYQKGFETLEDKEQDKEQLKEKDKVKERDENKTFDFESVYNSYPKKVGKSKGLKICKTQIKTTDDYQNLISAVSSYTVHCKEKITDPKYIKQFDTFMSSWRDWIDPETGSTSSEFSKKDRFAFLRSGNE